MEFDQMQEIDAQVLPLMKKFSGTTGASLYFMANGDHTITFTAGDPNTAADGIAELFARLLIRISATDIDGSFSWLREKVMNYYRVVMAEEARGDAEN